MHVPEYPRREVNGFLHLTIPYGQDMIRNFWFQCRRQFRSDVGYEGDPKLHGAC